MEYCYCWIIFLIQIVVFLVCLWYFLKIDIIDFLRYLFIINIKRNLLRRKLNFLRLFGGSKNE
jgi:hypothetical protein